MTLTERRQTRGQLVEQLRQLDTQITAEKDGARKKELEAQWDGLDKEQDRLRADIEREEAAERRTAKTADLEREMAKSPPLKAGDKQPDTDLKSEQMAYAQAFRAWLYGGSEGLTPEQRGILKSGFRAIEGRALSVGTTTAGGFTVPEGFSGQLEESLKEFGGMREAGTVFQTSSGADLPWPTVDDTANSGVLLAENTADAEQDVTFGQIIFKAYKYTSKIVRVSLELLQDSAFNLETFLAQTFATRIGRITNLHFTTGDNTGKPSGVVTGASSAVTAAGTTTVTYDEILDLVHAIDPAYRRQGARWMFNDKTLKVFKKMKDGEGRPLWVPGLVTREPDTLLGYPYTINQDVADLASAAKGILFGALGKYMIRDVKDITVMRLVERYAEFFQVGFIAHSRHDGRILDAGTDPIKFITQAKIGRAHV